MSPYFSLYNLTMVLPIDDLRVIRKTNILSVFLHFNQFSYLFCVVHPILISCINLFPNLLLTFLLSTANPTAFFWSPLMRTWSPQLAIFYHFPIIVTIFHYSSLILNLLFPITPCSYSNLIISIRLILIDHPTFSIEHQQYVYNICIQIIGNLLLHRIPLRGLFFAKIIYYFNILYPIYSICSR